MKKTVLAVAVGAALAAAGAAQADVTLFGTAHVSVDSIDNGTDGYLFVNSNDSNIGIKGSEEIEGGLKAGFVFQTSVWADDKTTTDLWNKDTYISLGGGFGEVKLGKIDSMVKQLFRKTDMFGNQIGDSRSMTSQGAGDGAPTDQIAYTTPDMGGVMVGAHFSPEDGTKDSATLGVGAMYSSGPIFAGVAYQNKGYATDDEVTLRAAGSMTFGAAKVALSLQSMTAAKGVDKADSTVFGVGGGFKLGNGMIKAQIFQASESDNSSKNGGMKFAVGYDHSLSKMTTAYAAFASVSNDDAGAYSVVGGGFDNGSTDSYFTAGEDSSGLSAGLIHKF